MSLPRSAGWPKHFLYFSPAKVDALFAQITMWERRKITHRLELNFKVIKDEMSFTTAPENFYRKLRVVLDYLDMENVVGSVDEPAQYVAGRLPMTWRTFTEVDGGIVFFGARLDNCSLGLGGSSLNVVGGHLDVIQCSGSTAPAILDTLHAAAPNPWPDTLTGRLLNSRVDDGDAWELDTVEAAVATRSGVTQDVEFVARRLLEGISQTGNRKIILGSPLYVALAD